MKKKILICNRGEIAIRVAKAARELGHTPVGLWTDNEKEAAHLAYCDQWVFLEGQSNQETYLNIEQILKIIKDNHIDAVHPGYGFLSENTNFCAALEKEGVTFIGPHADAIHKMGDKAVSKQIAEKAGVPVVPGSTGEIESVDEAKRERSQRELVILYYLKPLLAVAGKG